MKRNYAALLLGVTLAFSSVVYAAENTETAAAAAEDLNAEETVVYGEVTKIEENSFTVNVGVLSMEEEPQENTSEEEEVKQEGAANADDAQQESTEVSDAAAEENAELESDSQQEAEMMLLELTEKEQTISVTEDTQFYAETAEDISEQPAEGESVEILYAETEDETKEAAEANVPEENDIVLEETLTEEIAFSDLSEGDMVKITFDEDGNAEEVIVLAYGTSILEIDTELKEVEEPAEEP